MPLAVLLIALLAQAEPVTLEGIPNVQVDYYDVAGTSATAIRAAIAARGLTDKQDGRPVDALATWSVAYRWPVDDRGCDLTKAELVFFGRILLPHHVAPETLPEPLRSRWNDHARALLRHETTHIRLAYTRLPTISAAIRASDCADAAANADRAARAIDAALADYDRTTRHGETEGVGFP